MKTIVYRKIANKNFFLFVIFLFSLSIIYAQSFIKQNYNGISNGLADIVEINENYYFAGFRFDSSIYSMNLLFLKVSQKGDVIKNKEFEVKDSLFYPKKWLFFKNNFYYIGYKIHSHYDDTNNFDLKFKRWLCFYKLDTFFNLIHYNEILIDSVVDNPPYNDNFGVEVINDKIFVVACISRVIPKDTIYSSNWASFIFTIEESENIQLFKKYLNFNDSTESKFLSKIISVKNQIYLYSGGYFFITDSTFDKLSYVPMGGLESYPQSPFDIPITIKKYADDKFLIAGICFWFPNPGIPVGGDQYTLSIAYVDSSAHFINKNIINPNGIRDFKPYDNSESPLSLIDYYDKNNIYVSMSNTNNQLYVVNLDSNFTKKWERLIPISNFDNAVCIKLYNTVATSDGGVLILTVIFKKINNVTKASHYVLKFDNKGKSSFLKEIIHAKDVFQIYPNPFSKKLLLKNETNSLCIIHIFNMMGKEVYTIIVNDSEGFIDTSYLSEGLYFYEIKNNNGLITKGKLIKE